jgi:hypothetical protein
MTGVIALVWRSATAKVLLQHRLDINDNVSIGVESDGKPVLSSEGCRSQRSGVGT